jgi:hypothetical protein
MDPDIARMMTQAQARQEVAQTRGSPFVPDKCGSYTKCGR